MLVEVKFTLDVDPKAWAGDRPSSQELVAVEAARHAEFIVRDVFYDQEWIAEHHPKDHPMRRACLWCTPRKRVVQHDDNPPAAPLFAVPKPLDES